jgi:hypothetical protein
VLAIAILLINRRILLELLLGSTVSEDAEIEPMTVATSIGDPDPYVFRPPVFVTSL